MGDVFGNPANTPLIGAWFGQNDAQKGHTAAFQNAAKELAAARSPTMASYQNLLGQVQSMYRPSQGMLNAMYGGQRIYGPQPQAPQPQGGPGGIFGAAEHGINGMAGALRSGTVSALQQGLPQQDANNRAAYLQASNIHGTPVTATQYAAPQPNAPNMGGGYSVMPSAQKRF